MHFTLKDYKGENIGDILKKSSGCCKACFGDMDDFSLVFPAECNKEDKALLMFAMLLIDY